MIRQAVRAIIIEDKRLLVMSRNKEGDIYFTLVGGQVKDQETPEQALIREVREETGLIVTSQRLVFYEEHPVPHNKQLIYLCQIGPHDPVALGIDSEEAYLNTLGINVHTPIWVSNSGFNSLPFRTPQLQTAIIRSMKKGFPDQPEAL